MEFRHEFYQHIARPRQSFAMYLGWCYLWIWEASRSTSRWIIPQFPSYVDFEPICHACRLAWVAQLLPWQSFSTSFLPPHLSFAQVLLFSCWSSCDHSRIELQACHDEREQSSFSHDHEVGSCGLLVFHLRTILTTLSCISRYASTGLALILTIGVWSIALWAYLRLPHVNRNACLLIIWLTCVVVSSIDLEYQRTS